MGKDKLRRFAENLTFECFVQPAFEEAFRRDHPLKGHWHSDFFHNDRPIVLELGCGKGEYTVALAERDPGRNFIGIDIKGARMWRGAKTATERQMRNVGFLRTRIEMIASFFAEGEVDEIWITFPEDVYKRQPSVCPSAFRRWLSLPSAYPYTPTLFFPFRSVGGGAVVSVFKGSFARGGRIQGFPDKYARSKARGRFIGKRRSRPTF